MPRLLEMLKHKQRTTEFMTTEFMTTEEPTTTNPETHTCCTCGHQWKHGQHGGHSCSDRLLAHIAEMNERLIERTEDYRAGLVKMETYWRERLREAERAHQAAKVEMVAALRDADEDGDYLSMVPQGDRRMVEAHGEQ